MDTPDPEFVAASRRRDLLLTLVMLGILLTPAWLTPSWFARPWLVVALVLGAPAVVLTWTHGPWMPTPSEEMPRILAALDLSPGDHLCDLGAGDGRMLLRIHDATGATCTGIEAEPLMYLLARLRLALQGDEGTRVQFGNLYGADLSTFDVVYVWGTAYSVGTDRFRQFVVDAMRPGARLVAYHTPIPGLDPVAVDDDGQRPLYTYVMPSGPTGS